jgi:hypothetical protein
MWIAITSDGVTFKIDMDKKVIKAAERGADINDVNVRNWVFHDDLMKDLERKEDIIRDKETT